MKKIAVVLSGSGHLDGSEIHEAVLTLLALSKAGVEYEGVAPDREHAVMNHVAQAEDDKAAKRNILKESARIVRGNIKPMHEAHAKDYDAIIFPGGFGAAKNLCDFGLKGNADYQTEPDVLRFAKEFAEEGKPAGFICIAPMLIPHIYGAGVKMTIGNDSDTANVLTALGVEHVPANVDGIVIDHDKKVVSTPAYMLGQNIYEVSQGIDKLVEAVLEMAN